MLTAIKARSAAGHTFAVVKSGFLTPAQRLSSSEPLAAGDILASFAAARRLHGTKFAPWRGCWGPCTTRSTARRWPRPPCAGPSRRRACRLTKDWAWTTIPPGRWRTSRRSATMGRHRRRKHRSCFSATPGRSGLASFWRLPARSASRYASASVHGPCRATRPSWSMPRALPLVAACTGHSPRRGSAFGEPSLRDADGPARHDRQGLIFFLRTSLDHSPSRSPSVTDPVRAAVPANRELICLSVAERPVRHRSNAECGQELTVGRDLRTQRGASGRNANGERDRPLLQ